MPAEEFIGTIRQRTESKCWVAAGNYMNYQGRIERAELIVWLDYPFRIVLWRVLRRTAYRLISRKPLWNGNRETLRLTFSRESIIIWVFQTYWKRRKQFPLCSNGPKPSPSGFAVPGMQKSGSKIWRHSFLPQVDVDNLN